MLAKGFTLFLAGLLFKPSSWFMSVLATNAFIGPSEEYRELLCSDVFDKIEHTRSKIHSILDLVRTVNTVPCLEHSEIPSSHVLHEEIVSGPCECWA